MPPTLPDETQLMFSLSFLLSLPLPSAQSRDTDRESACELVFGQFEGAESRARDVLYILTYKLMSEMYFRLYQQMYAVEPVLFVT